MRVLLQQRRGGQVPAGGGRLDHREAETAARAVVKPREARKGLREVLRAEVGEQARGGGDARPRRQPRQPPRAGGGLVLEERGDHVDDREAAESAAEDLQGRCA